MKNLKKSNRQVVGFALILTSGAFLPVQAQNTQTESFLIIDKRRVFHAQFDQSADKKSFLLQHLDEKDEGIQAFLAQELGNFDGPVVIAALEKLAQIRQDPETMVFHVGRIARSSLERMTSDPALARLTKATPLAEAQHLIQKYAVGRLTRPSNYNAYADNKIFEYLKAKLDENPPEIAPILARFYLRSAGVQLLKYPELVKKPILEGLKSPYPWIVDDSLLLWRALPDSEALPLIVALFLIPLSDSGWDNTKVTATLVVKQQGAKAVPFLVPLLYSRQARVQIDALNLLWQIGTPEATASIQEFQNFYAEVLDKPEFEDVSKTLKYVLTHPKP